jgi:leader peptidase (prepilin peptidase) / N-methyltransferase
MQLVYTITAIYIAVFGLVIGSFLNVCIYRIPQGETIVKGRSHCMSCNSTIKARDLIPVFSFLWLRGKCRHCGAKISSRYPAVELINAVLWLLSFLSFGLTPKAFIAMAFLSGLIIISFIDIDTKTIPNSLLIYILAVGIVSCFFNSEMPFYEKLLGIIAGGAPLLLINILSHGNMGWGDILFTSAAGLLLGWRLSLVSLFFAFIIGAIIGIIYMLAAHKDRKSQIPFGPFLALGMITAVFLGNMLINLYLSAFQLN